MKQKIVIIGAGGHGKVVADAVIAQKTYELVGFVDTSLPVGEKILNDFCVIEQKASVSELKGKADVFIVAVGNNTVRQKVYDLALQTLQPAIVIHPSAIIGSEVSIGKGSVVLANSVINASSKIGKNTIINAGVIVDHDCTIGDHIHVSSGTIVGSNSSIENEVTTSIGGVIQSFSNISK